MTTRVVTVTPTIMDGTVVRWHRSWANAENPAIVSIISASRNGVMGGGDYIAPGEWMAAWGAHVALLSDQNADLEHLATHRKKGLMGPLECLHRGIRMEERTFTSATITTRCMTCQAVLDERNETLPTTADLRTDPFAVPKTSVNTSALE
jgi:hypothetical protein